MSKSKFDKEVDELVDVFQNIDLRSDAKYINDSYPGAFYKKIFDDGRKIKIYRRGKTDKVYFYPEFSPNNPYYKCNTLSEEYWIQINKYKNTPSTNNWDKSEILWEQYHNCIS